MNKKIKNIIIILLLISIIPLNINAMDHKVDVAEKDDGIIAEKDNGNEREDGPSPTETVGEIESNLSSKTKYYFMTYPNGVEKVTENETEANNPEEELIYEGKTNEYGEIILEGWNSEGQLRIVEAVPNGYTTNQREIVTNLAESSTVGFVNNKGIIDPNTGRTIIYLFIVAFLITLVILSVNQRKTQEKKRYKEENINNENKPEEIKEEKKARKKKSLKNKAKVLIFMLIPICLLLFLIKMNANAETKNFVITVHDGHGNKMANVEVKVYAKPIKVETHPAIIFDANGGTFFDGTTKMYFKLPYDGCTRDEFFDSLTFEENNYLTNNRELATKQGNVPEISRIPVTLYNGQVIDLEWLKSMTNIIEINGNGGAYNFYGRILSSIKIYDDRIDYINRFTNPGKYLVGSSSSEKCSNYNQYGIEVIEGKESPTRYLCWNEHPDGIYVNNALFIGTKDNCFKGSNAYFNNGSVQLQYNNNNEYYTFGFERNILENTLKTSYLYPDYIDVFERKHEIIKRREEEQQVRKAATSSTPGIVKPSGTKVNTLIIRENGEDVLSLTSNELECTGSGTYADRFISRCSIENTEKLNYLKEYVDTIYSNCYKTSGEIKLESDDYVREVSSKDDSERLN